MRVYAPGTRRGVVWDTAVDAGDPIFSADLGPSSDATPSRVFRLTIGLEDSASVLNVEVVQGATRKAFALNSGNQLEVDTLYAFEWGIEADDGTGTALLYNVSPASNTTVGYASLQEV